MLVFLNVIETLSSVEIFRCDLAERVLRYQLSDRNREELRQ